MKPLEAQKLVEIAKEYLFPTFARDASSFGKPASIIESAEGRHFTDIFGNRLLEPNSSGGAAPLGYNVPELVNAMVEQIKKINTTTPSFFYESMRGLDNRVAWGYYASQGRWWMIFA
ncbi:MAG: hypothetical protein V1771_03565 [Chloroflexota bacterium]